MLRVEGVVTDYGEIEILSTVKDLVGGLGLRFADRGIQVLKGPGDWHLFAVERG